MGGRRQQSFRDDLDERLEYLFRGVGSLYLLYLIALWFTERNKFWVWLAYGLLAIAAVVGGIIAWRKLTSKMRFAKMQGLLKDIRQHGQEEHIINFINRFGLENRNGNGWSFRNHTFDWYRIGDLEQDLAASGVRLTTTKGERDVFIILRYYIQTKEEHLTRESIHTEPQKFALLNGLDFEKLLYRLYAAMGYAVEHIGRSGDQGGDLIANKNGQRMLIEAKCYQDWSVGNAAVQQVVGAMKYYDCQATQVVTTATHFTAEAIALAGANHTELISKDRLTEMLMQYLHESWV